jgi:hypothetical protein
MELASPSLSPDLFLEGELLDAAPYGDCIELVESAMSEIDSLLQETADLEKQLETLSSSRESLFPTVWPLSLPPSASRWTCVLETAIPLTFFDFLKRVPKATCY